MVLTGLDLGAPDWKEVSGKMRSRGAKRKKPERRGKEERKSDYSKDIYLTFFLF